MEIIGDDKKLRALYSETRLVDAQVAPSFSATWHRAQARAKQPRRAFAFAFASALAVSIFAVATLVMWSKFSPRPETYSAFATPAGANIAPASRTNPGTATEPIDVKHPSVRKPWVNKLATRRQQLLLAQTRKAEKEAKEIASWRSPTASLLSSSSDNLFKSLPQLNENANELKSFLPNRSNDKEK